MVAGTVHGPHERVVKGIALRRQQTIHLSLPVVVSPVLATLQSYVQVLPTSQVERKQEVVKKCGTFFFSGVTSFTQRKCCQAHKAVRPQNLSGSRLHRRSSQCRVAEMLLESDPNTWKPHAWALSLSLSLSEVACTPLSPLTARGYEQQGTDSTDFCSATPTPRTLMFRLASASRKRWVAGVGDAEKASLQSPLPDEEGTITVWHLKEAEGPLLGLTGSPQTWSHAQTLLKRHGSRQSKTDVGPCFCQHVDDEAHGRECEASSMI